MYFPGDICPRSAVYLIFHYRHRASHQVVVTEGVKFPECKVCGPRVGFQILASSTDPSGVRPVVTDKDFGDVGIPIERDNSDG